MGPKILVSNVGFGQAAPDALEDLRRVFDVFLNEEGKRYTEEDFLTHIPHVAGVIAGTEKISSTVLQQAKALRLIARVGVGVDSLDLAEIQKRKISMTYTPDAPSASVPEFTLSLILGLLKGIGQANGDMHRQMWKRPMGRMLSSLTVGVLGAGRIGQRVIYLLKALAPTLSVYFYDPCVSKVDGAQSCDLASLFKVCDLVTLHVPYSKETHHLVGKDHLMRMKKGSFLVSTSRGGRCG